MARRKQRRPQHLENEKDLANSLQNGIGSGSDTEEDEHVCGKCRAEFPSLSDFLQHKKQCVSKRPVLIDPPQDSSVDTEDEDEGDENSERLSPQSVERQRLQLPPHPSLLWGNISPFLLLAQHRTDTNVTLEELKNTTVAVAQHGSLGESGLRDFISKFQKSQIESLQLIKHLENIVLQNTNMVAAPPALIGTAALTPPQSADGQPLAPSAPSLSSNLASYPQGGRTEEDQQVPLPENSLALLEKQTEKCIQDSMSRRAFILNGMEDDKSKRNKIDDPTMRHRCQFCGKLLGSDSALQIHIRSHTGEKPFSCSVCGSSFSTRGNLKVHFQRHRENDELLGTAADGQRKQPDNRNCERRSDNPPVLYPNDTSHKGDSSKGDQALDFSTTVNGRKSPNDDNSRSVSPNDMSNFSENSDGSSDENMTAENFSELKIDVERFDEDDRDNSNIDDDGSEVTSSQTGFGTSPSFAPYFLPSSYDNFAASTSHQTPAGSNANNSGTPNIDGSDSILQDPTYYQDLLPRIGSNDNSWESLIEVTKTSETSKLQQLVDNIEHKLTEPNQCIICHRVLSCKSALQMHYRTHTGERPFKCKLCSRAFTTKGNLKTHMGVHRTKPAARILHQCPVCHKTFQNPILLQQHVRVHTDNPALQLTPLYACDERPPTLLPPSYPRQFLVPPQLVNTEPLALTSSKAQESKNTSTNESVIKATGLDTNISSLNPCTSPALSSASSCSPSCNLDDNTSKDLQPPVLDLAQPEQDINEEKMNDSPSDIPKITEENNSSPERVTVADRNSPCADRSEFQTSIKQEPPNLVQSPKSISNSENENRSPSNVSIKSPPKFSANENSLIVSLASDRPLPMTLPSDCPLPFSVHNSDRPYPPMSVPDFTTASLTALENHVKGIASNVAHPLPFAPHFGLGLNVPSFYRDYNYHHKSSTSSPSASKNGSDGSADERSTPGTGVPNSKGESPRASMVLSQSTPKSENGNGAGALDLTPRNSPGFQRPAGTEMKIFAPLAGLPFGPPHHRISTTCRICFKTFACQSALEIHYRSHTKERPFRCEVCDRGFSTKGNMRQHMLTHKIRDLPAQVFSNSSNAPVNVTTTPPKVETNEEKSPKKPPEEAPKRPPPDNTLPLPQPKRPPGQPKHLCQVCNKPFSSGSALQIHMRTHTGDKPFQCHICHRAFTTKGNLKVHMGTHMWNTSTSRRGRRMSLELPLQLPPGAKPGEFSQAPYFPYLSPFMNGLPPPPQPPPKMNEISVIQTAGVSNGAVVTSQPATTSSAPSTPQQPLPLLSSSKREEQIPSQNQNHLSQGNEVHAVMQPTPEIAVSWPWKISCKICNKICSSSTELELHVRNNHSKRESPETPVRTDTVP